MKWSTGEEVAVGDIVREADTSANDTKLIVTVAMPDVPGALPLAEWYTQSLGYTLGGGFFRINAGDFRKVGADTPHAQMQTSRTEGPAEDGPTPFVPQKWGTGEEVVAGDHVKDADGAIFLAYGVPVPDDPPTACIRISTLGTTKLLGTVIDPAKLSKVTEAEAQGYKATSRLTTPATYY